MKEKACPMGNALEHISDRRVMRSPRICECGDHGFANLTRWGVALVSPDDLKMVNDHGSLWCLCTGSRQSSYAINKGVLMHRLIAGAEFDQQVDHLNHDKLDNRRENLRLCSTTENACNKRARRNKSKSKFKGVQYWNPRPRWQAKISINGKSKSIGLFETEEEAAKAYDNAAKELHGEFAATNESLGLFGGNE